MGTRPIAFTQDEVMRAIEGVTKAKFRDATTRIEHFIQLISSQHSEIVAEHGCLDRSAWPSGSITLQGPLRPVSEVIS